MKIKIFFTFIFIFYCSVAYSTNIRVIDFQKIINNNSGLVSLYEQIEKDQKKHKLQFENEESILKNELENIEKLNLILEPAEMEEEIENYNNKLKKFNQKIEKFNLHYELQINSFKNELVEIMLDILKKYSLDNKIDLITDSNNYILSSNSINITDIITELLNKKKIESNFEKY